MCPSKERGVEWGVKRGIGARTDVFKVVMLSTGADALLRVRGALETSLFTSGVYLAKEDGLELVHARVGELQGGIIVGHHWRGRNKRVPVLLNEEIDVGLAYFLARPVRHDVVLGAAYVKTASQRRKSLFSQLGLPF